MNREWHNKPLQGGGRDAWDYGRTELVPTSEGMPVSPMEVILVCILVFTVTVFIAAVLL